MKHRPRKHSVPKREGCRRQPSRQPGRQATNRLQPTHASLNALLRFPMPGIKEAALRALLCGGVATWQRPPIPAKNISRVIRNDAKICLKPKQ